MKSEEQLKEAQQAIWEEIAHLRNHLAEARFRGDNAEISRLTAEIERLRENEFSIKEVS